MQKGLNTLIVASCEIRDISIQQFYDSSRVGQGEELVHISKSAGMLISNFS